MSCSQSNNTSDLTTPVSEINCLDHQSVNPADILTYEAVQVVDKITHCGFTNIFVFIGVPANLLTMIVFYRQGLRDRMNLCLFCLAFTDLMFLASYALIVSYCLIGIAFPDEKDFYKWFFMKHGLYFKFGFGHSSGCLTMIIAVERCVCVVFPIKSSSVISTKTMAIILLVTFIVIQLLCSVYIVKENMTVVRDTTTGKDIITLITSELSFLKGQAVLMRMLVAVSSVYILCATPTIILALVRFAVPDFRSDGRYSNLFLAAHGVFFLPFILNSSVNFFVYTKMSSRFRHELQTLCLCTKINITKSVVVSTINHVQAE
ncbi:uncharacterized protein LOC112570459 [Pomacea canaliculata]|uniref:uncharacterized protein LOC112570459 n=1 Tax=Pomacea canaliculata TaxID=400727 RepID=UPI000D73A533|nr:uncharacterized protein LOC112570459 [Pomacea canaliculata]